MILSFLTVEGRGRISLVPRTYAPIKARITMKNGKVLLFKDVT